MSYALEYRQAVFDHYGWACACCGRNDRLTIDHIDGNGREHREAWAEAHGPWLGGPAFYRWLCRAGLPDGFQTLCAPCNSSKGKGERCRLKHAEADDLRALLPPVRAAS